LQERAKPELPTVEGEDTVEPSVRLYVGIDVGKRQVDVALGADAAARRFSNDDEGIEAILKLLAGPERVERVVLEASGGYQRQLLAALLAKGYPAVAVNPRQVRDFAKAAGKLEKTDAVDAGVLALFAERMKPHIRPVPDETLAEVSDWISRRRQLMEMLVAEKNRQQQAKGRVRRSIEQHIAWLKEQLRDNEKDLMGTMKSCPSWDAVVEVLDAEKGVGRLSAISLLAALPELGTLNRKKIAKLAGLAPISHDSGSFRGQRKIRGGRTAARSALYMATLVGTRCNPTLRTFYARLLAAGKCKSVALTACMRKLLTILNAIVRKQRLQMAAQAAAARQAGEAALAAAQGSPGQPI
jgi:transposase